MTIEDLIEDLPIEVVGGSATTAISDIVEDSRSARPGCLFVARCGATTDGHDHIADAARRGAAAVLATPAGARRVPASVTALAAANPGALLGLLAERVFGRHGATLDLVGVTGTNGKTTVAHFVQGVLAAAGVRCGLLGTVFIDDGAVRRPAALTTPPAVEISRALAAMAANGCTAAALEVSSHALHQGRTGALRFGVGVFTNLSGDHLDYHGSMDEYARAKAMLFAGLAASATAVVNADDPAARRMLDACRAQVLACSLADRGADCFARIHGQSIDRTDATLAGPWGSIDVVLPLAGRHNVANALQAAAACFALGCGPAALRQGLARSAAPPGRLEAVTAPGEPFAVLVDYAHTDDALASVLGALRALVGDGGRLRVVFGCGGDRDRTKRPRMGAVAAGIADEIIITSDNPRTEDPQSIIGDILPGVAEVPAARRANALAIPCRREAIERAIERGLPGDVVLIAGKGHEPYQVVGSQRHPFDDRRVAAEALAARRPVGVA